MTTPATGAHEICVEIGSHPVLLRTPDHTYRERLANRYAGFLTDGSHADLKFDIDLVAPLDDMGDDDVEIEVEARSGIWRLRRSDFRAEWDCRAGRGYIRQAPSLIPPVTRCQSWYARGADARWPTRMAPEDSGGTQEADVSELHRITVHPEQSGGRPSIRGL